MSNTPSRAEIEALVKRHGATSYRNRADTQHPAYGFTEDGLNGLIDEVLAKWGTPPAVPWRSAVLDLIDDCPGLPLEQDRWLSRRVKELDFASTPQPTQAQATEPVAWAFKYDDGTWHDPSTTEHSPGMRPLCAAPQPVAREPLTCEWTHNDDDGYWDTSCGKAWRFDDGGPKENNMNFCHCCGKTLRIKGGQHG